MAGRPKKRHHAVRYSELPPANRFAHRIKTGYEIQVEPPDGAWRRVKRKQRDDEHGIILFTFEDETGLRVPLNDRVRARRTPLPTEEGTEE